MSKYNKHLKIVVVTALVTIIASVSYIVIRSNIPPTVKTVAPTQYKDVITVYADKDYEPYSFIDKNGNVQGYDIELIYKLAQEMKVNVDLKLVTWSGDLSKIDLSGADIVLGLEYKEKYKSLYNLSHPVQVNEFVAFGKESIQNVRQLFTKKIGVLQGSSSINFFIKPNHLSEKTIFYPSYEEGFQAILNGDIEYLIGRYQVGKRVLAQEGISNIDASGEILATNTFAFGVQKGDEKLLKQLNSAIAKLNSSGYILSLTEKWLGYFVHITSLKDFIKKYLIEVIVFFVIFFSIFILIVFKRKDEILKMRYEKETNEKLRHQLETDTLTGYMSKYQFDLLVKDRVEQLNTQKYTILSIDIDNFKYINESYGYAIGDKVLQKMMCHLMGCFGPDDLVTRVKDDNFVVLTKNTMIDNVVNNTNHYIPSFEDILGEKTHISISVGVCSILNVSDLDGIVKLDHLIDYANIARRTQKDHYGNTVSFFTEKIKSAISIKQQIILSMESALKNREFFMLYQPKYCLQTGTCVGAEALVRWRTSSGSNFYPNDFIPIFEQNGFIVSLDYYVMDRVCSFIANSTIKSQTIAVNVSGQTLLKSSLVDDYYNIVKKYGLDINQIEIEITESSFVATFDVVKERVYEFRKAGFVVAVDDFGAGVSSLNRIQSIEIDVIKLDRELISHVFDEVKGVSILNGIISTAKELNTVVVAEGIETKEQLELLQTLGCDLGQGYYLTRPISADEYKDLLNV